jgi:hypothetical protein
VPWKLYKAREALDFKYQLLPFGKTPATATSPESFPKEACQLCKGQTKVGLFQKQTHLINFPVSRKGLFRKRTYLFHRNSYCLPKTSVYSGFWETFLHAKMQEALILFYDSQVYTFSVLLTEWYSDSHKGLTSWSWHPRRAEEWMSPRDEEWSKDSGHHRVTDINKDKRQVEQSWWFWSGSSTRPWMLRDWVVVGLTGNKQNFRIPSSPD